MLQLGGAERQRGPRLCGVAFVPGAVQFEEVAPRERRGEVEQLRPGGRTKVTLEPLPDGLPPRIDFEATFGLKK